MTSNIFHVNYLTSIISDKRVFHLHEESYLLETLNSKDAFSLLKYFCIQFVGIKVY